MTSEHTGLKLLLVRIINRLGRPFGINPFPRAFENSIGNNKANRADIFDTIYKENYWGSAQSKSGVGSEKTFAERYRADLLRLIDTRGLKTLFDAPCGDLNWMTELISRQGFHYIGGDISRSLIDDLKKRHSDLELRVFDICQDEFPAIDAWHCRDCLFHLSFEDIRRALRNFTRSNIPFALLTTHRARLIHRNLDISTGGFRFLDLERPPFNLPKPVQYLPDYRKGSDFPRYMGLWRIEAIREASTRWPKI